MSKFGQSIGEKVKQSFGEKIKKSVIEHSVFVDTTAMSTDKGRGYNIFVFKKNFKDVLGACQAIERKVSERSEFKELANKLSNKNEWSNGKPIGVSKYKQDKKKYFFALPVDEISVFRDMIYAHKNKFHDGSLIVEDRVVQRNDPVKTTILSAARSLKSRVSGKNSAETVKEGISEELDQSKNSRIARKQEEYKAAIEKYFEGYNKKIEKQNRKMLEVLNPLLNEEDKIEYKDIAFRVSEPVSEKNDYGLILDNIARKKKLYRQKYDEETAKHIEQLLDKWAESVASKMRYGFKAYAKVAEYLKKGYIIMSVLGAGGSAVVVKFLDEKGRESALKIFYNQGPETDQDYEHRAIRDLQGKLGTKKPGSKKSALKKYFNAPKIRKDGEVQMKIADKVLDAKEFIKRGGKPSKLNINFFGKLAYDTLKALSKLNALGEVHGDIKPDNIHLKSGRFKVADVATIRSASDADINTEAYTHPDLLDRANRSKFTPEQWEKNDVYALGCTMADVLCGKRLNNYIGFNGDSSEIMKHFTDETMQDKANVSQLLKFVKELCSSNLDDVPMAKNALKSSFVVKWGRQIKRKSKNGN